MKNKKQRVLATGVSLLLFGGLLSACSSASEDPASIDKTAQTSKTETGDNKTGSDSDKAKSADGKTGDKTVSKKDAMFNDLASLLESTAAKAPALYPQKADGEAVFDQIIDPHFFGKGDMQPQWFRLIAVGAVFDKSKLTVNDDGMFHAVIVHPEKKNLELAFIDGKYVDKNRALIERVSTTLDGQQFMGDNFDKYAQWPHN